MLMHNTELTRKPLSLALTLAWVILLAYVFSQAEIHIEGAAGWAARLPTWRIEHHWALDLFWGGRPMTGYHAWVFPFIALVFHFPLVFAGSWSWRAECRVIACVMLFWLVEDFLWFVTNPAYGLARFNAETVGWHKHWLGVAPIDYWVFAPLATVLFWYSSRPISSPGPVPPRP